MADFYVWKEEELGLGVQNMDKEHQILISKMNALYAANESKSSPLHLKNLIDDLAQYTIKHFADEEAYMDQINYPEAETHKVIHKQLLAQFNNYVEQFKTNQTVSKEFFNFLKVWLTSHIRGIDMKYSAFSKGKKFVA